MLVVPTTYVSVLRADPEAVNEWGDPTDAGSTTVSTNVPAAVVEQGQIRYGLPELRNELIESITIRVPFGTDVIEDDRVVDELSGDTYLITGVSRPHSIIGASSVRLIATRSSYGA